MIVTLIGNNNLYKLDLQEDSEGDYWLTDDYGKKIANIIVENRVCYFKNTSESRIVSESDLLEKTELFFSRRMDKDSAAKTTLTNYSSFNVVVRSSKLYYLLFCVPSFEILNKYQISVDMRELVIGSDPNSCQICFNSKYLLNSHAKISKSDNVYVLQNFDWQYGTFLNNVQIKDKAVRLSNGDVIFIMGLKLILVGNYL